MNGWICWWIFYWEKVYTIKTSDFQNGNRGTQAPQTILETGLKKSSFRKKMGVEIMNIQCNYNIWAATWQNQQNGCAPSEDSDQRPVRTQISVGIRPDWSVFAFRKKKAWVLSYPLSALWRLWPDWVDAQADPSLRWAHTHFVGFVMLWLIYTLGIYSLLRTLKWENVGNFTLHRAWSRSNYMGTWNRRLSLNAP